MLHQTLDDHIQTESRCHVNGRAAVNRLRWRRRRPLRRVNLTRTTKVGAVASYEKTGGVRIPIFDGTMNERAEIAARRDVPHIHVASMHNLKSDHRNDATSRAIFFVRERRRFHPASCAVQPRAEDRLSDRPDSNSHRVCTERRRRPANEGEWPIEVRTNQKH